METQMSNAPMSRRSRISKTREVDVRKFINEHLNHGMTIPARIADALNFAAETVPGVIIPYNILLQMVMGYDKQPRIGTEEVLKLRTKMTDASRILHEKYGRGKHSIPGVGVRATIDSADRLTTEIPRKRTAARSAVASLTKSMKAINIKEVPNTPEYKDHRDWYLNHAKNILDGSNDLIRRLLPAAPLNVKKEPKE